MHDEGRRRDASRLRALDGLRFLAAAAVVVFHYTGRDNPGWGQDVHEVFPTLSRLTVYGGFGPYLFFMISGFVVLMSAWGRSSTSFIASRVGRLYPAYWAAVVLVAAVLWIAPVVPVWSDLGAPGVALNLTMFQSAFGVGHVDGVFWTLWVELKFYVLLALVGLGGFTRGRLLLLCLAWPLLGAMGAQAGSSLVTALLEPNYAPFFCIGILLYLVRQDGWSTPVALLLGANVATALWVCKAHYVPDTADVSSVPVSMWAVTLLFLACLGAVVLVTLTRVAEVDWRWLTTAGALTYPLYLVHELPGWALIQQLAPVLPAHVVVAVTVTAALAVAWGVHRFVERPLGPRLRAAVQRDLDRLLAERSPRRRPVPPTTARVTPPTGVPTGMPPVPRHAAAAGHGAAVGADTVRREPVRTA
ncbi:Peptidoglycan/LPS O-acetylase OafA/YrhL, contains acyltransferase and SGNH-hydrolase domains [Geodermatophilus telluris]|uniref:Peptidoglycan/LPS O-acetylase OafA/YrhL, contains acyltransferase and SGNH-hydrolase domains n=1 Tax=Geodermatophilus telluris TaxID=1190417 RepID=A0A1G6IKC7_9ACTN|nr:acyltransferase [Geodermatophilus telluris]SDC06977.1 Peptidoglycan/LPS O-acetylase OafA/YrhL, contains acyltransferase and SGNH-hydrolase domains [Geodermatophilus telluris]